MESLSQFGIFTPQVIRVIALPNVIPGSFAKRFVNSVARCADKSPTAADAIEDEVQEALAICGGDMEFQKR